MEAAQEQLVLAERGGDRDVLVALGKGHGHPSLPGR
jgi:hypothetical protein